MCLSNQAISFLGCQGVSNSCHYILIELLMLPPCKLWSISSLMHFQKKKMQILPVSSHFEELLYNHMAHLQDGGTQIHVPREGNSSGLQLLCKMSHANHGQDCPTTCADRHQRRNNFGPELKMQIKAPSFSLFARTAGPSYLCFLISMQADFLNH